MPRQDYVHPIIDAFLKARALAQEQFQTTERSRMEAEKIKQEEADRKEKQRQYDETLRNLQAQFKADHELKLATLKASHAKGSADVLRAFYELSGKGVVPPGASPVPIPQDEGFRRNLQEGNFGQMYQNEVPLLEGIPEVGIAPTTGRIATPESIGTAQLAIGSPLLEERNKLLLAKARADELSRVSLQSIKDEAARIRNEATIAGRKEVAEINAASRIAAAKTKGALSVAELPPGIIDDIDAGVLTVEKRNKEYAGPARLAVSEVARKAGSQLLQESQITRLYGLSQMEEAYRSFVDYANVIAKGDLPKIYSTKELVMGMVPALARTMGQQKGSLSDKDIALTANSVPSFITGKIIDPTSNTRKLAKMRAYLDNERKTIFSSLSPRQRNALMDRFSLPGKRIDPTPFEE